MAQVTQTNQDGDTATFTPRPQPIAVRYVQPHWLNSAIVTLYTIAVILLLSAAGYEVTTVKFWVGAVVALVVALWLLFQLGKAGK